jgi:CRP-like cAMP-binding protein
MLTAEELRQAKIFACLDEGECARLAHTIADVRLEPGEWLFREGAPPAFYVLMEGRLRIVLDVHGKQTEIAEHEFKPGDFVGEVPLSDWYSDVRLIASSNLLPHRAPG